MTNPFKKHGPYLPEIHEYILDMQRVMMLREKATSPKETADFDYTLQVMREVLIFLNTLPQSKKKPRQSITLGA